MTPAPLQICPVVRGAHDEAIWAILEPMIRTGETYPLVRDMTRKAALDYWFAPGHTVYGARSADALVGTFYLRANQTGAGSHVANCGYVVHPDAQGRGVARAMCMASLGIARQHGFSAMQFNLVVSTNLRAIALWQSCGFSTAGRLPGAFRHPAQGEVDALVMFRRLDA